MTDRLRRGECCFACSLVALPLGSRSKPLTVTESLFVHVHKIRVASDNKRLARCTKMALTQSRKVK